MPTRDEVIERAAQKAREHLEDERRKREKEQRKTYALEVSYRTKQAITGRVSSRRRKLLAGTIGGFLGGVATGSLVGRWLKVALAELFRLLLR